MERKIPRSQRKAFNRAVGYTMNVEMILTKNVGDRLDQAKPAWFAMLSATMRIVHKTRGNEVLTQATLTAYCRLQFCKYFRGFLMSKSVQTRVPNGSRQNQFRSTRESVLLSALTNYISCAYYSPNWPTLQGGNPVG